MASKPPEELPLHVGIRAVQNIEKRLAMIVGVFVMLIALAGLPWWKSVVKYLYVLQSDLPWHPGPVRLQYFLVAVAIVCLPLLSWLALSLYEHRKGQRWFLAAASACLCLIAVSALFAHQRTQWFFLEACKVRTERFSFSRSLVFWRSNSYNRQVSPAQSSIFAIGSSQVNFAINEALLSDRLPRYGIHKKTLPGFNVLQYKMVVPELRHLEADIVVCWLSEFDFFREDRIPANRLRGQATISQVVKLIQILPPALAWDNRAEMADVFFATVSPLWRDRDIIRVISRGFWWKTDSIDTAERVSGDSEQQLENLRRSIRRTELLDVNFRSFAVFARQLADSGIRLIVFEGHTHPGVMRNYETSYRIETRSRLQAMSESIGFEYVTEKDMPVFTDVDFVDIYHVNEAAQNRFTLFLADYLNQ